MIKAIFFDVDGTLLEMGGKVIPPRTLQALHTLRQKGVRLFLSTGRHLTMLAQVREQFEFDGYVTVSGQFCLCGDQVVYKNPIPRQGMEQIISAAQQGGFSGMFLGGEECWLNLDDRWARQFIREFAVPTPPVCPAERGLTNDVYQVIVMLDREREHLLLDRADCLTTTRWHPGFLDALPPGGGKDVGMEAVLRWADIPREQAMAFGDGENDISMLRFAGVGVAMGNASDGVKAEADYVTGPVDQGGTVDALEHFGLI
ncbi:MAG: Cof-type HAD-IIB family hydrolase [Oscillospiraceae bacterium]|nr:Cof-type HAD-IIB family hydrolase [Oscillospiraceae bacterium]